MFYYDTSFFILIPAILLAMYAQVKVKSAFNRYSQVRNSRNMTGADAARRVLDANGLSDIKIVPIRGNLTDNYDPRTRQLNLSETVYGTPSISAVSVACHEAGHALQHAHGYVPLKLRNGIVPVVNFASHLSWPLIFIGLILLFQSSYEAGYWGNMLFNIGIITFAAVVFFHLITLPVEFNASHRALQQMEEQGVVDEQEIRGSRRVLSAAALTYVAALAVSVANLLRLLAIRGRN